MTGDALWEAKERMRREIRARRKALSPGWLAAASRGVADRLEMLPAWRAAEVVGCYLAVDGEVRTDRILERAARSGKRICVPAFYAGWGAYRMAWYEQGMSRVRGPHGVPEPARKTWVDFGAIDCVALPGLAFDAVGRRLGHGGGHIDRLLARAHGHAVKIGLAFSFQVKPIVPAGTNDQLMDVVVTEKTLIKSAAPVVAGGAP